MASGSSPLSCDPEQRTPLGEGGCVFVVMGVSGVGKTTVGQALANAIGAEFAEGDSYHSTQNVEKMRAGQALSDEDRWPWLDRLRLAIDGWLLEGRPVVLTCSALKARYRERLTPKDGGVRFVHLEAKPSLIAERLTGRAGHYMPASLLQSQLQALEPPEDAITVAADQPLDDIIRAITATLSAG